MIDEKTKLIIGTLFGLPLIIYEFHGLIKKSIKLGLFGGPTGYSKPLITRELTGRIGFIASIICILAGICALIPFALSFGNITDDDYPTGAFYIASIIVFSAGVLITFILDAVKDIGELFPKKTTDRALRETEELEP